MSANAPGPAESIGESLAAFLAQFVTEHRLGVIEEQLAQRTRHLTVALEGLRRTHNTSACLRSCDAFGIQDVHLIEKRYRYRVNRDIERGSAQWLTLVRHTEGENNSATCVRALRRAGYRIVATSPRDDALPLEEFDVSQKAALFFGRERDGLSDYLLAEADERVRIPMYGFAESLNISVAVAICLHHLSWKLRTGDVDWELTDSEKAEIRLEWLRCTIGHRFPQLEREFHRRR